MKTMVQAVDQDRIYLPSVNHVELATFDAFTAVRIIMLFFWVSVSYRLMGRCQRFGETYCLRLQS
jgi:hypothetical protein